MTSVLELQRMELAPQSTIHGDIGPPVVLGSTLSILLCGPVAPLRDRKLQERVSPVGVQASLARATSD
jgi:hypothetical protein